MIKRFSSAVALVALIGSFVAIPATHAFAQVGNSRYTNRFDVPITGVVQNVGTLAGTFSISRFAIENETLVAKGQLNGTITDTAGNVVRTIVTQASWPVANASGSGVADAAASCDSASSAVAACDILNLILGPLHLDLLGLVIDLNQVVLEHHGHDGGRRPARQPAVHDHRIARCRLARTTARGPAQSADQRPRRALTRTFVSRGLSHPQHSSYWADPTAATIADSD